MESNTETTISQGTATSAVLTKDLVVDGPPSFVVPYELCVDTQGKLFARRMGMGYPTIHQSTPIQLRRTPEGIEVTLTHYFWQCPTARWAPTPPHPDEISSQ